MTVTNVRQRSLRALATANKVPQVPYWGGGAAEGGGTRRVPRAFVLNIVKTLKFAGVTVFRAVRADETAIATNSLVMALS